MQGLSIPNPSIEPEKKIVKKSLFSKLAFFGK
jgi:hypothetical protein